MNYKVVSSKAIIAKAFRDLKLDNDSFVADALEWIGEGLEFIGVHSGLEKDHEDVTITNFRGHLPCDLHLISTVEYNGMRLNYGSNPQLHGLHKDSSAVSNPYALEVVYTAYVTDPNGGNQATFQEIPASKVHSGDMFYTLNPGKIETSFESGTVRIHYMKIPLDGDNFPLVPDNATVKEALIWYILRQLVMGGYRHPIFSFDYLDAKWEAYCGKAQNDLMFPSVDKVERFRDMWVSLIPNVNAHESFRTNY